MKYGNSLLLIIVAALIVSGCGRLSKKQIVEYGEIGYADVISFIVQGYEAHWDGMSPDEMNLSPVYSYCSPYAGFARKDIDGDGLEELLIGDCFDDGNYVLYDILCLNRKDASLIHLASGGERDMFSITGDGIVVETGSNSAFDSFVKGYRLRNGQLEEVDSWEETLMDLSFEKFSDFVEPEGLCGGYTEQRELTEEEMELFRYVTGYGETVFTPLSVSTQVVAGTNYRFWCRYQDPAGSGHCWITVFKPLPGRGNPQLTSIVNE